MATLATRQEPSQGRVVVFSGGIGVNDNDVLLELDARAYHDISIGHTAGAVDVFASLDGTNYLSTPVSLVDMGDTTGALADLVAVTAANRVYRVQGPYYKLRFMQNGAVAVTGFTVNAHEDLS